jgi:hypothetical protein
MDFCVVNGSPAGKNVAPYVALLAAEAKCPPTSLYRGQDAEAILHRHGKSSQRQLYEGFVNHVPGFLPANPPGYSTHEMHSDGVAYPEVARGARLPHWWMEGMDFDDSCVDRVIAAARRHGWELFRPYPSGSEHHHVNFKHEPRPRKFRDKAQIIRLRATLPRR